MRRRQEYTLTALNGDSAGLSITKSAPRIQITTMSCDDQVRYQHRQPFMLLLSAIGVRYPETLGAHGGIQWERSNQSKRSSGVLTEPSLVSIDQKLLFMRKILKREDKIVVKDRSIKTPVIIGLAGAFITLMSAILTTYLSGNNALTLETRKFEFSKDLEERKFQSALIIEVIKTGDLAKATRNLSFLLNAKLIDDPGGAIQAAIDVGKVPILPSVSSLEARAPIGVTATVLDSRRETLRSQEAAIGNLIADSIREKLASADAVVLFNGGAIRGNRVYPPGTILTRWDIMAELPFELKLVIIDLSGADLLAALENGVSQVENRAGRFPQVSNIAFTFDPSAPAGSRVVSAKVGGADLEPERTYRVATNDYMYRGGDGYAALTKGQEVDSPFARSDITTIVMDYIVKKRYVEPRVEGRIKTAVSQQ